MKEFKKCDWCDKEGDVLFEDKRACINHYLHLFTKPKTCCDICGDCVKNRLNLIDAQWECFNVNGREAVVCRSCARIIALKVLDYYGD